ncbi:MAG: hypothetical protein ACREBG_02935, partial [Pyrinomonadaceae bacterium]
MLTLRNPRKSGQYATITFTRCDGMRAVIACDTANARRFLMANRGYVIARCEQAAVIGLTRDMAMMFAECKARVSALRRTPWRPYLEPQSMRKIIHYIHHTCSWSCDCSPLCGHHSGLDNSTCRVYNVTCKKCLAIM